MLYGRSDISSVTVTHPDGRRHVHERGPKNPIGEPFEVDCGECEAKLQADDPTDYWATAKGAVQKTADELDAEEEARQSALGAMLEDPAAYMRFVQEQRRRATGRPSRR